MSYVLPTPPASGLVVDPDGIVWTKTGVDSWSATCPQCHTPQATQEWGDLLRNKGPLEDVPSGMLAAGEVAL